MLCGALEHSMGAGPAACGPGPLLWAVPFAVLPRSASLPVPPGCGLVSVSQVSLTPVCIA